MNIHLIERSSSRSQIAALQQGALPYDKLHRERLSCLGFPSAYRTNPPLNDCILLKAFPVLGCQSHCRAGERPAKDEHHDDGETTALLIAVSCLALACPVRLQIDLGQNHSITLTDSPATAKEGNNGNRNGGNGKGNGNGNSGNSGNSGNPETMVTPTVMATREVQRTTGTAMAMEEARATRAATGMAPRMATAAAREMATPTATAVKAIARTPDNRTDRGHRRDRRAHLPAGNHSGQKASNSQGAARSSQSPVTGGLSALFRSHRRKPAPPLLLSRSCISGPPLTRPAKAKPAPARPGSRQASVRRETKEDRTKARNVDRSGVTVRDAISASLPRGSVANAPAGSPLPKPARAKDSIVAVGLSPLGLNRLKAQGFQAELQTRGTLVSVARLVLPAACR